MKNPIYPIVANDNKITNINNGIFTTLRIRSDLITTFIFYSELKPDDLDTYKSA